MKRLYSLLSCIRMKTEHFRDFNNSFLLIRGRKKKALMTSQILAQVRSSQRALRHGDTCTPSPHHTKMNLLLTTSQFTDPNAFPSPISLCEGSIKEQGSVPRCTYNAGSTTGSNILELSCCCTAVCSNC